MILVLSSSIMTLLITTFLHHCLHVRIPIPVPEGIAISLSPSCTPHPTPTPSHPFPPPATHQERVGRFRGTSLSLFTLGSHRGDANEPCKAALKMLEQRGREEAAGDQPGCCCCSSSGRRGGGGAAGGRPSAGAGPPQGDLGTDLRRSARPSCIAGKAINFLFYTGHFRRFIIFRLSAEG